jgi:putative acetyltransferase
VKIRKATVSDHPALLDIWLESVRATHHFLSEDDIQALLPIVRDAALPNLELWVLTAEDGSAAVGFMGLDGPMVEALFIAPRWSRKGGGRQLLDHARSIKGRLRVDVNEQNPEAVRFYLACDFEIIGRSPVDSAGRPFPLLHMQERGLIP